MNAGRPAQRDDLCDVPIGWAAHRRGFCAMLHHGAITRRARRGPPPDVARERIDTRRGMAWTRRWGQMAVESDLKLAAQDLHRALSALRLGLDLLQAAHLCAERSDVDPDAVVRALLSAAERAIKAEAVLTASFVPDHRQG
jgi:hypothetical protein